MEHYKRIIGCCLGALLLLTGCGGGEEEEAPPDPHAGQAQVLYGSEGYRWVDVQEGVPVSAFRAADFSLEGQYRRYTGTAYETLAGIDVSEHQNEIDWKAAGSNGVDFAMIRAGYRGSTGGGLYIDERFLQNITEAKAAGVEVGVYFFSQATDRAEAAAEAYYLLSLLEDHPDTVTLPVVFDWEETGYANSRTADVEPRTVTICAKTFCDIIRTAGYEPGVYLNRNMGYYTYDLTKLQGNKLWFAAPEAEWPDFYYAHDLWQYSFEGHVAGVPVAVDLDLYLRPVGGVHPAPEEPVQDPDAPEGSE